ncbi:VWA domain-containing protein [Fibrella aquatilis]|uniref:VWA domain-containing protein n=1 Tax=Fibrella aquatilis TaxID=2817059 RepID=A0A939G4P8_9BACT|nr:VWA domain-containing protein [Fibrella aquatilis]MBO0931846.1 VWA domain-containing protein [Fibrella aquatilis]
MSLIFQTSPWWVLVCLLAGVGYAALLYQPLPGKAVAEGWGRGLNYGLAALRFLAVTLLALLLLNPLIRSLQTRTEAPKVVLAIDNSESMVAAGRPALNQTLTMLQTVRQQLTDKGYDVSVRTLSDTTAPTELGQLAFRQRTTDLSKLLNAIRSDYEGRHLTDVILLTDGLSNQGLSPTFGTYPFAVRAVGVGDTVPKKDVLLKAVVANRVAYLNNSFPVKAEITSNGFAGRSAVVVLRQGTREVGRQTVRFDKNDTFSSIEFKTTATQKGVQRFTVDVLPQEGEFSRVNNRQDVYIEVIDGREKVLLLGLAPHPDLKAFRAILEKNQNYDVDVRTLSTAEGTSIPIDKTYDLLILHQLPDITNIGNAAVAKLLAKNTPTLFVVGVQSSVAGLNPLNPVISVLGPPNQTDKAAAYFNPDFKQLNLDQTRLDLLDKLPPLTTPYGEYKLLPGSETVLWQQIGTVRTTKPLLAINTIGARKTAVLLGEGLWQWRLEEYDLTNKQEVVDELIQKVLQLISVKEDRRKLRVYPVRNEFLAGEAVSFETELYNDIYERQYGLPIRLDLIDERDVTRTYNYTPTEANSRFDVSRLPEGVYRFKATTTLNNRAEQSLGQFIVRDIQLEAINTTADFGVLRQLAAQSGGTFYTGANAGAITNDLTKRATPARLSSTESLNEIINWRWIFFLILTLTGTEWALRKYNGGY